METNQKVYLYENMGVQIVYAQVDRLQLRVVLMINVSRKAEQSGECLSPQSQHLLPRFQCSHSRLKIAAITEPAYFSHLRPLSPLSPGVQLICFVDIYVCEPGSKHLLKAEYVALFFFFLIQLDYILYIPGA